MKQEATFKVRGILMPVDIGFVCKSKTEEHVARRVALKLLLSKGWQNLTISEVKFHSQ